MEPPYLRIIVPGELQEKNCWSRIRRGSRPGFRERAFIPAFEEPKNFSQMEKEGMGAIFQINWHHLSCVCQGLASDALAKRGW